MMDEQIKEQWVKALRSGDYKQGKTRLETDEGFCCLGVLCDLAVKAGIIERRPTAAIRGGVASYGVEGLTREISVLPRLVVDWAGLIDCNPLVRINGHYYHALSHMNDIEGSSFLEIADLIEEQL